MDTLEKYKVLCTEMLDMGQHLANVDTTPRDRDLMQFKLKAFAFRKKLTEFINYIEKEVRPEVKKANK